FDPWTLRLFDPSTLRLSLEVSTLFRPNVTIALVRDPRRFDPEEGLPGTPAERVLEHGGCVPNHEARIVAERLRHVPQLHPSLGPPAAERHLPPVHAPVVDAG